MSSSPWIISVLACTRSRVRLGDERWVSARSAGLGSPVWAEDTYAWHTSGANRPHTLAVGCSAAVPSDDEGAPSVAAPPADAVPVNSAAAQAALSTPVPSVGVTSASDPGPPVTACCGTSALVRSA